MLEVRNLDAGYGQLQVLRSIDIDVQEGEIVAVLGSNGAGKSTLNNNISGIFKPFGGTIRFRGQDITGNNPTDIVSRGLVHVPEGRRVFPNLTVMENLKVPRPFGNHQAKFWTVPKVFELFPPLEEFKTRLARIGLEYQTPSAP